tara:strand:- start:86 stop:481 length:396 start_codon:yes stop_codon:yes gene_type:complete
MEFLEWSIGVKPERSKKKDNPSFKSKNIADAKDNVDAKNIVDTSDIPAEHSDNDKITEFKKVKGDYSLERNTYRKGRNMRESSNNKLTERHMVSRACGNPFLTHLNYTDEILTQEQFLIPKNSNMENENEF